FTISAQAWAPPVAMATAFETKSTMTGVSIGVKRGLDDCTSVGGPLPKQRTEPSPLTMQVAPRVVPRPSPDEIRGPAGRRPPPAGVRPPAPSGSAATRATSTPSIPTRTIHCRVIAGVPHPAAFWIHARERVPDTSHERREANVNAHPTA